MWHCISNVITVYLYDPLSQGILSETAPDVVPRFYVRAACLCTKNTLTK